MSVTITEQPPYKITVTETAPNQVTISGVGVQGPQGPTGPTGSTGPQGPAGAAGVGVPTGGTTNQVLAKKSNTDYDTEWVTGGGGGGSPTGAAGGDLGGTYPNPTLSTAKQAEINAKAPGSHVGSGGAAHANATTSVAGFMSGADKTKLDGVAAGATANDTDANLKNRANHTGTQLSSTISDFNTAADARVAAGITGKENTITPGTTSQYYRGDKTFQTLDKTAVGLPNVPNLDATLRSNHTGTQLASTISDFASTVRSTVLTGLSLATNQVVAAGDTILQAIGYLQKQITDLTSSVTGKNAGILFEDEGSALGAAGTVDEVDFTGTGVTASRTGNKVTVNVSGGGGGGQASIQFQDDGTGLGTSGTVDTIDFVGTQVAATRAGNKITVAPKAVIVENNISANTTFTAADIFKTHRVTTGGTDRTMTLPTTGVVDGDMISFEKVDSGSGFVIINNTSFAMLFQQNDFIRFRYSATLAAWDVFIYSIAPFVENFTTSGTWTKRPLLKYAYVACISGGGGGGSGRTRAAGSAGCGGGGGGGGAFSDRMIPASQLGATETVTVGVGGTGGVAQATASSVGNIGGTGGVSSFGTAATQSAVVTRAPGGGPGGTATTTGTAAGGIGLISGGAGAPGVTGGAAGAQGSSSSRGGTGGGSGGGVTTANAGNAGGQGSGNSLALNTSANVGAGSAGAANGGTGGNGSTISSTLAAGAAGGGGGGGNPSGNGGLGGNGGTPGGGGGGGGAGTDGFSSGAGGNGGNGLVQVINFF